MNSPCLSDNGTLSISRLPSASECVAHTADVDCAHYSMLRHIHCLCAESAHCFEERAASQSTLLRARCRHCVPSLMHLLSGTDESTGQAGCCSVQCALHESRPITTSQCTTVGHNTSS